MHRRHGWCFLVLVVSLLAGSHGQAAAPAAGVQDLASVWNLPIDDTNTKGRIARRAGQSFTGRQQIAVPLACPRALAVLSPIDAWALSGDGHLGLLDGTSEAVLDFAAADAAALIAIGLGGEVHQRASLQGAASAPSVVVATKQQAIPAATADAAGRYSILRDGGKDTGCMLTLDGKAKGPGGQKASLAPGCRDQGIVIFDPVGWQLANGRLVLTARKGHKTHLDAQADGTWKKDPKEGKSLALKKL